MEWKAGAYVPILSRAAVLTLCCLSEPPGEFLNLSVHSTPNANKRKMLSPAQKLCEPHCFGFLWRFHYPGRLVKSLLMVIEPQSPSAPSPSVRSRGGAERFSPLITSFLLRPAPIPKLWGWGRTKSHLLRVNSGVVERGLLWITKDSPITTGRPRALGTLCQEPGT